MIKRLLSAVLAVVMGTSVLVTVNAPVSDNTDSEGRSTWAQVGGFKDPTCADYVSRVMADCSYYPGAFEQTPSAPTLRNQLKENGYQMVARWSQGGSRSKKNGIILTGVVLWWLTDPMPSEAGHISSMLRASGFRKTEEMT